MRHSKTTLESAHEAFAAKLKWLRDRESLSQLGLVKEMKKKGREVSQKSVSNIERIEHDSQLSNYVALADHFGVPLWVMFVPGLSTELLEGDRLKRLVGLVQDYLACSDDHRAFTEKMAEGYAGLNKKK